jgi:hypothetical protein
VVPARGDAGGLKHVIFLAVKRDSERPGARPEGRQRGSKAPPVRIGGPRSSGGARGGGARTGGKAAGRAGGGSSGQRAPKRR